MIVPPKNLGHLKLKEFTVWQVLPDYCDPMNVAENLLKDLGCAPDKQMPLALTPDQIQQEAEYIHDRLLIRYHHGKPFRTQKGLGKGTSKPLKSPASVKTIEKRYRDAASSKDPFLKVKHHVVKDLKKFADLARTEKFMRHEPLHDLFPGILWLDEIFGAMLKTTHDLVKAVNAEARDQKLVQLGTHHFGSLQQFINETSGIGGANEFTSYVIPHTQEKVHPTRLELWVRDGKSDGTAFARIAATSLIVGDWRGGSHSSGSAVTS